MNLSEQNQVTLFKPVDGGYVFRMPFYLGFGPAPHYLVTESEKAELSSAMIDKRPVVSLVVLVLLLLSVGVIVPLIVYAFSPNENPGPTELVVMTVLIVGLMVPAFGVWRWWQLRRIAPIVARLTPTDLRITNSEMQSSVLASMSMKQLWFVLGANVFAAVACLGSGAIGIKFGQATAYIGLACGVVFTALTIHYGRMLMTRRRAERGV